VARAVLQNPDNTFMEALKKDSLFADNIIEDFKHQLENFFIVNFFETLPYKNMGLVGYLYILVFVLSTNFVRSLTRNLPLSGSPANGKLRSP
jgi:hypothetical protein